MALEVTWSGKTAMVDYVVSEDDGECKFEVYLPDDVGNLGTFASLDMALVNACQRVGFAAETENSTERKD